MSPKNIGSFIKELRKEKGITQEELAENLNVSGRTVSRWETGTNMPDISLLVEISEFFDVSIPEIINGERKSVIMNEEVKEVADKLSDYANAEKETIIKSIRSLSIMGAIALVVYGTLEATELVLKNVIFEKIAVYCETLALITVLLILAHTTGLIYKLQNRKKNSKFTQLSKVVQAIIGVVVALVGALIIKILLSNVLGL